MQGGALCPAGTPLTDRAVKLRRSGWRYKTLFGGILWFDALINDGAQCSTTSGREVAGAPENVLAVSAYEVR